MNGMPVVFIPNVYASNWGDTGLSLAGFIEDWLDGRDDKSMLGVLKKNWAGLGSGKVEGVPKVGSVPQVEGGGGSSQVFENYSVVAAQLSQAFTAMQEADLALTEHVKEAKELRDGAQDAFETLIEELKLQAAKYPEGDMSEDEYVLSYVATAMQNVTTLMERAAQEEADGPGSKVEQEASKLKEVQAALDKANAQIKDLQNRLSYPTPITQPQMPAYPPPVTTPDLSGIKTPDGTNPGTVPTPIGLDPNKPGGINPPDIGKPDDIDPPDIDPPGIDQPGGIGTPPPGAPGAMPPGAGMGGDMGMGMMMQQMMQQMMMAAQQRRMQEMAERDMDRQRGDLERTRFQQPPPPVPPAAPAAPTQNTVQPAAATNNAPPTGASSTQPMGGAPTRTPGADGLVDYTYPDGRTQKVSPTVAQALDKAFDNKAGTDAQAAYAETPAKWSDKKDIGGRVDPSQLMTGDVGVWTDREAVLIVFGPDEGNTLEAVVAGEIVTLNTDDDGMNDKDGSFGQFEGFAHPKGIEAVAADDAAAKTAPGTPASDDPAAGAAAAAAATPV